MSWLQVFSSRVVYYGQVLDTLAQHHPEYVGLVWGIIKFVLLGIINHAELVEQFSEALSGISQVLPAAKVSAELYQTDQMKDAVGNLYAHILRFLQQAFDWYNARPARRVLNAVFNPFQLCYKLIVDKIKLCAETIDTISNTGLKSEVRSMHLLLQRDSLRFQSHERKLDEMQLEFRTAHDNLTKMVGSILQIAQRKILMPKSLL
ncbi:hypothetical protein CGCTS75_v006444 [Colletotrichum tropicale]|nr:hypothetical protein CGCTS75_v006444 [Colletotrichum tropicale]